MWPLAVDKERKVDKALEVNFLEIKLFHTASSLRFTLARSDSLIPPLARIYTNGTTKFSTWRDIVRLSKSSKFILPFSSSWTVLWLTACFRTRDVTVVYVVTVFEGKSVWRLLPPTGVLRTATGGNDKQKSHRSAPS